MQPYKCPVCDGRGFVPNGFYNTFSQGYISVNTSPETCRTCNGSGVVWCGSGVVWDGNDEHNLYIKNE